MNSFLLGRKNRSPSRGTGHDFRREIIRMPRRNPHIVPQCPTQCLVKRKSPLMTEFQCIIFIFSICSIFHLIRILLNIINNTGIPETGCHTPYPERVHVSDRSIDPVKRICFLTGISRGFQIIKTTIQKATVISQSPSFAQRGLHDRGIHFHPCLIGAFPHASFHDHGPRTQISVLHGRNTSNHLYRFNIIGPDFPQVITTSYNIKLV